MDLEKTDIIERPLEEVFALVRDHLVDIVPYLPNVRKIDVLKVEPSGNDTTKVLNHWYAKVEIPAMAKKFVKEDLFSWMDEAVWNNAEKKVNYKLTSFLGNNIYDANGENTFVATPEGHTKLTVRCSIVIHAGNIPGVPKFLVKKVLPKIEELLRNSMEPNMTSLGKGIKSYFMEKEGK